MKKIFFKTPSGIISAILTIIVLYLTLTPISLDEDNFKLFEGADKIIHFIMFFVIGCVYTIDYSKKMYPRNLRLDKYIAITVFCFVLGGLIEYLQDTMNVGRSMDALDFLSDCLGSIVAFLFCYFFLIPKFRQFLKKSGYKR